MKYSKFYFLSFLGIMACRKSNTINQNENPNIPYASINLEINLNGLRYQSLSRDGGYFYQNGGVKGILIYREDADTYWAFERNCPFEPTSKCATVSMDLSRLYLRDTCCQSVFDFRGNPTGGPAVNGLKRYYTELNGTRLRIIN